MYLWLDSILWSISRAYRRRKIRQSRVYSELLAPIRPDAEALDRALERPAILSRVPPIERTLGPYRAAMLAEKLQDEAVLHGSWPQYSHGGLANACSFCAEGEHGLPRIDPCDCPCHRGS